MIKEKIKFLADRVVEAQGEVRAEFKAGKTYELPAPSARRWVNRGLAEPVAATPKRPAVKRKSKVKAPKTNPFPVLSAINAALKVDHEGIDKETSIE